MNSNVETFLPSPTEISEQDLETVSGGTTPTAAPAVWAGWAVIEGIGIAAGAIAAAVTAYTTVDKKIADEKVKQAQQKNPPPPSGK